MGREDGEDSAFQDLTRLVVGGIKQKMQELAEENAWGGAAEDVRV